MQGGGGRGRGNGLHNKPAVGSNLVGSKLRPACAEGREGAGGETTGVQERQRLGVVVKKVNFLLWGRPLEGFNQGVT